MPKGTGVQPYGRATVHPPFNRYLPALSGLFHLENRMSKKLRELQARKAAAAKEKSVHLVAASTLLDKSAAAGRDLTAEEQVAFDAARQAADAKGQDIERIQAQIDLEQETINAQLQAAGSAIEIPGDGRMHVSNNAENDPTRGFRSFGDFARAVIGGSQRNAALDPRLAINAAAPSTVANEGSGADGGFVIPPAYSTDLFRLSLLDNALLPYTSNVNVDGNSMVFPKTEQTPWGSNGVRAYWQAEATAAQATKPVIGTQALRLHKLMALVPLTDELMADSSALQSEVPGLVADSIKWKVNEALLFGNGNGQPLGALLSSGPAVTQAKDTGQATNTLTVSNLFNMLSRLPNANAQNAIWLIHPTVIPLLATLVLGQIPVFLPGGMANVGSLGQVPVFGTLLGRPVILSHHAAAVSSAGDVQLLDLSYYRNITKADGITTATSLHLYFDADAAALRVTFRVDGSPKIAAAISPAKGSTTLSPFIQLGAR